VIFVVKERAAGEDAPGWHGRQHALPSLRVHQVFGRELLEQWKQLGIYAQLLIQNVVQPTIAVLHVHDCVACVLVALP
jgi:hypothetical protein